MTKKEKRKEYLFDPILPDIKSWPIHLLTEDRKNVIRQVLKRTKKAILNKSQGNGQLDDIIANAMFLERARIKQNPWKIDPKDEEDFWKEIKEQLLIAANPDLGKKKRDALEEAVLEEIIVRYAEEIAGTFKVKTYNFASDVTPYLLAKLVKASAKRRGTRLFAGPNRKSVYEKIILEGHTAQMRELAKLGTVVLVPTHFSNLDSLVMGWCIQAMGLPAFLYGAGLNLFNTRVLSYFMSKLGAYKLDRRKKNRIYLETLKNYQTIALQRGVHSLFFPWWHP